MPSSPTHTILVGLRVAIGCLAIIVVRSQPSIEHRQDDRHLRDLEPGDAPSQVRLLTILAKA